jgi:hypothetical protein
VDPGYSSVNVHQRLIKRWQKGRRAPCRCELHFFDRFETEAFSIAAASVPVSCDCCYDKSG